LTFTAAEVKARPHIQCRVIREPLQEVHTIKVLCEVQSVSAPFESEAASAQPQGAATGSLSTASVRPELPEVASQICAVVDSATEGLGVLSAGESIAVLQPWEFLTFPTRETPVVLALVAVPFPST
jgi:hypothetical protein